MSSKSPINYFAKLTLILLFFAQLWSNKLLADHYYGGYFYYEVLSEKSYQVTLITYTHEHNDNSDRDSVKFFWGDNSFNFIHRQNNGGQGEEIYLGMKKNVYIGTHTYADLANYQLYFSDDYRLNDVTNIASGKSGTTNIRFDGVVPVQDSSRFCQNNSPKPLCDPYFYGVENQTFSLNFGYWDQDGDSIVYEISNSLGANGETATGYSIPSGVSIDPKSGQFTWANPTKGKYSFAFTVNEYRNGLLLGKSSTDFTVFISQIGQPALNVGSGGITSGTNNGEYRFLNPESKEFTFTFTYPASFDSIVTAIKSPLNFLPEFSLTHSSTVVGSNVKDTLNINYFGSYLLSGYHPVIWEVTTYVNKDSIVIQQFPLLIAVENNINWPCEIPDISDLYEVVPNIPSFTISPSLFDEYVWINIGSDFTQASIYVYDTRGRLVKFMDNLEQETVKIDMLDVSSALYFLQVVKDNKVVFTGKMVKR